MVSFEGPLDNRRKVVCIPVDLLQAQERRSRRRRVRTIARVRLRLYHHPDGARVAYRELGAGPPLALLHSAMLSHKEFEPAVEQLADRFRVVLPDLPLHGDSEDRPRYPYTLDWFAEVISGFAADVLGPRPLIGGHDAGAEILLQAISRGSLQPKRLVLMGNRLHAPPENARLRAAWRLAATAGAVPGLDRLLTHERASEGLPGTSAKAWRTRSLAAGSSRAERRRPSAGANASEAA
jgi:pimeloyl-ACP methyl ester carboxylesterase